MGDARQKGHAGLEILAHQVPRLSVILAKTVDDAEVIGIVMTEYENRREGIWVELQDHSTAHVHRNALVVVLCTPYYLARRWLDENLSTPIISREGGDTDGNVND